MSADPHRPGQTTENGRPICGARKKNGDPCGASPKKGHTRCARHGGNSPQSTRAAQKRNTTQRAARALRALGHDPDAPNIDPAEALLKLVSDKAREVAWLRIMVDTITNANGDDVHQDLVWGVLKTEIGEGPMGPINTVSHGPALNQWVQWLHKAEDQLANYSARALQAGVAQKRLELDQAVALQLVGVINQVIAGLNLSGEQRAAAGPLIASALRALDQKDTP